MRWLTMVAIVFFASLTPVCADEPLTPAEAAKKVGQEVSVAMEVNSSRTLNGIVVLNSESDFRADGNFTLFINGPALTKFKAAKIDDPAAHFKNKKVIATGKVSLFRDKPQIALSGPDDIKIVE